jgi:hypothetical protein
MYWDSVAEREGEERWWWGYLSSCVLERQCLSSLKIG